jgi:hypothetical protein
LAEQEQGRPDELYEQIKQLDVQQYLVATSSTLASIGFAKLDAKELQQAKTAIDAVAALVPLVEGDVGRDLRAALANLQVAYAGAVSTGS